MIQTESKQILLSIIAIAILIIAFVGVSYAAFTGIYKDSQTNGISTGTISLYLENKNGALSMENVMPISDENGKSLEGDGNVYDFIVQSNLSAHTTLNYEISLEKVSSNQEMLSDSSVRFYLQRLGTNGYEDTAITQTPQPFIPLDETSFLGSKKGSMILYSGTLSNTSDSNKELKDNFRLRMWVSQDTIIDSVSRNFNIKLNVTAKAI